MPKRTICVVTGTRAEYGLLYWLMKEINTDEDLELQLVVTGTHLSAKYGLTSEAIEAANCQALAYDDEAAYERLTYGGSGASVRIKNVLRTADLTAFRKKRFFDIPMAAVA